MNVIKNTAPIIQVINEDYLIPQLNKRRRVAAILPHDYHTSAKYYPVLYLHDGQNLFDDYAPFGNWGVDKSLRKLAEDGLEVIVIAIDHGGKDRISEYMPYDNPKYTYKNGEAYLQFMMEDLKPYIDTHFRVKTERENTGIGGSSMGGLISLYAGFNFNNIFGKMMIFSPSIWISEQVYQNAKIFIAEEPTSIYLYTGGDEMKSLKPSVEYLAAILKSKNNKNINITLSHLPEGKHQEYYWGLEFPKALEWLFKQN
jgi:predicted alpha/beta superfamily hydrolase